MLGVEGELAQAAILLDEVDRDEVAASRLDQLADSGVVGHLTGARGLTVGLVLLPCTIVHSCLLCKPIHNGLKTPFMEILGTLLLLAAVALGVGGLARVVPDREPNDDTLASRLSRRR